MIYKKPYLKGGYKNMTSYDFMVEAKKKVADYLAGDL
nr:MAG TPA: hypothetical protein [Caudoviricetes sp.]